MALRPEGATHACPCCGWYGKKDAPEACGRCNGEDGHLCMTAKLPPGNSMANEDGTGWVGVSPDKLVP
jgi:hypothetical protein